MTLVSTRTPSRHHLRRNLLAAALDTAAEFFASYKHRPQHARRRHQPFHRVYPPVGQHGAPRHRRPVQPRTFAAPQLVTLLVASFAVAGAIAAAVGGVAWV